MTSQPSNMTDRSGRSRLVYGVRIFGIILGCLGLATALREFLRGDTRLAIYSLFTAVVLVVFLGFYRLGSARHLGRSAAFASAKPDTEGKRGGFLAFGLLILAAGLLTAGLVTLFLGWIGGIVIAVLGIAVAGAGTFGLVRGHPEKRLEQSGLELQPAPWASMAALTVVMALGSVVASAFAADWLHRGGQSVVLGYLGGIGGVVLAFMAVLTGAMMVVIFIARRRLALEEAAGSTRDG